MIKECGRECGAIGGVETCGKVWQVCWLIKKYKEH